MKNTLVQLKKMISTHKILAIGLVLVVVAISLFASRIARAGSILTNGDLSNYAVNGLNNSIVPDPDQFSRGRDIFMEISQPGNISSLNAKDSWAKVYIDPNRLSSAVVGIYAGAFTGCGVDYGTVGCLNRAGDVQFEFYGSTNIKPDKDNAPNFIDDAHCLDSFKTINSRDMHDLAWDVIRLNDYADKGCGGDSGNALAPTKKTGQIVIFIHATWITSGSNRTNAFKVGGAYTDNNPNKTASARAGYWSPYDVATKKSPSNFSPSYQDFSLGEYAIQDRVGANKSEQGDYVFPFGPDCYLSKDQMDPKLRYIKWYDVDLDFYKGLPSQPNFELFDKTANASVELTDVDGGAKYTTVSGSALGGKNKFKQMSFQGKGGHLYVWRWRNIVQRDGIVFWMPYDDFPFLNNGCGDYKHELNMKAGANYPSGITDFEVAGEESVAVNLTQIWSSTTSSAGPNTSVQLTLAPKPGSPSFGSTFDFNNVSQPSLGGHSVSPANVSYRTLQWPSAADGTFPRLGPQPTYASSRPDIYAYFHVKQNAQDGAQYCLTASMTPAKNSDGSTVKVTNPICFTIKNSLKPYLATSGADVHAGDCNRAGLSLMQINGMVNPARGSSGSYIVSAGGSISAFGSGGAPKSNSLTLGKSGRYGTMCRPGVNVLKAQIEEDIVKKKVKPIYVDGANYDLGSTEIAQGGNYVVLFSGSGTVTGVSKGRVTVYSPGDLTIGSNFGSNTGVRESRDKLPVVGVIANNIKISPSVTSIYATLYAVNNIDTCTGGTVGGCKNKLTLTGFAMAHDFSFKRTTGSNGLNEAEVLNFNAAFYLSPPSGFGLLASDAKYLGERAPLY